MNGTYTKDFRASVVKKLSGPDARSATALAQEVGVPQSTLSRWLREYGTMAATGGTMSSKKRPQNWTAEQKLEVVMEYLRLDEETRGRYLREKGLYSVDVERWREEIRQALEKKPNKKDPKDQRIRQLEGELRRKEKALAETAALLVLKKKAQNIWGDSEDEK